MSLRICLTLAILGLGAFLWQRSMNGSQLVRDANQGPVTTDQQGSFACSFVPGKRLAYQVQSRVIAEGTPAKSPVDYFSATLSIEVVEELDDHASWKLSAGFSDSEIKQSLSQPHQRIEDSRHLEDGFLVTIDRRCRFVKMGFPAHWDAIQSQLVATLLSNLEFVGPENHEQTWQVKQRDGMAPYAATYKVNQQHPLEIERRKHSYHSQDPAQDFGQSLGIGLQIVYSKAQAQLAADHQWLASAEGLERVRISGAQVIRADLVQKFSVRRHDDAFVAIKVNWRNRQPDWQDPFSKKSPDVGHSIDPSLSTLSLEQVLARFLSFVDAKSGRFDSFQAARFLADWLRARPDQTRRLLEWLEPGELDETLRPSLFLAWELSGTSESLALLVEVMADSHFSENDRSRAASALSDIGKPSQLAFEALRRGAQSPDIFLANISLLALGHLGYRAGDENALLHQEIRHTLESVLQQAEQGWQEVDAIDAIANSRDDYFVPDLEQKLNHSSHLIRAHTAEALGAMATAKGRSSLLNQLLREGDPDVKVALIRSLQSLKISDDQALSQGAKLLSSASEKNVQVALVSWLGQSKGHSLARASLSEFAGKTNDSSLLQQVGRYLSVDEILAAKASQSHSL